jgi:hypothetical protein
VLTFQPRGQVVAETLGLYVPTKNDSLREDVPRRSDEDR